MSKTLQLLLALWLIAAGSIGAPQPCLSADAIVIRGESEVRGRVVRLSDVFEGVPMATDVDIAQAPAPGKQVIYDVKVLSRLAQKYQLDWQPQSYNDRVLIKSGSTRIPLDAIRDAVIEKVKASSVLPKGTAINVTFDNRTLEVNLPADQEPEFTLNNFTYDSTTKRFRSDLTAQTGNGPLSVSLMGRVNIKRSIPVLVRRLDAGVIVAANDFEMIEVSEDRVNASVITDMNQIVGRELRRDTDAGELLYVSSTISPRYVTRGALVTMKVETPIMQLTAQGKALQDGAEGEVVKVLNTQSNRIIEATVSGPGTVLVRTVQKLAAVQ